MLHFIELTRAGLERFSKAMQGGSRPHLYVRRERVMVGGKYRWRYYYRDDDHKKRNHKKVEEVHGKDAEHHTLDDLSLLYDSHRKQLPPTSRWTEERLSQTLYTRPKVKLSSKYRNKHLKPEVSAEKHGRPPERNVTQRIGMALSMIPERVAKLANITEVQILDSSDPALKKRRETTGRPVPACFMERGPSNGFRLVLVADEGANGVNTAPHGDPHFGSSLTLTEERIWNQVGQMLIERAKKSKKLLRKLGEFRAITRDAASFDEPVSGYAKERWEMDFAESYACLMSHPKQLATQAPDRYRWLMENGFGNSRLPKNPDDLLDEPASKYAWYEARKYTRTKAVLDKLMEQSPTDIPYRSEKDEFFQMTVDGRTVYIRVGPPNAASEPGWERMPDAVDEKTGLPVYDSKVSNRWQVNTAFKEIYDEHGNRLDPVSAMFHLQQGQLDDRLGQKWEAKLPDKLPDDPGKLRSKAMSSSWHLGRKIFNATGENRAWTAAEKKKERDAIAKLKKQGKLQDKRARRWEWVPHRITMAEFMAKTPTFKFDGVRQSKEQPHIIPGKKDHDHRGREVPALQSRRYEVTAKDGSTVSMLVHEAAAFETGQTIKAPVVVEVEEPPEKEGGKPTVRHELKWQNVELAIARGGREPGYNQKQGKLYVTSLDPKVLARELKTSESDLLKINGRFRQYQLIDPVMAALINPNNRPIRQAGDLFNLIHEAAKAKSTAWVSVHFDNDVPAHSVHAKVSFDGGGSPLLVGDYWKRKLGMDNPRVSDLLSSSGKLRMQKPRERKPRRPKINIGDVVRVNLNGQEVFGYLLERNLQGKRAYKVSPIPGQKSPPGWERMPETVTVSQVRSVPSDRDPERPNIRLRQYIAPDSDLLLYSDEVEVEKRKVNLGTVKNPRWTEVEQVVPGSGMVKIELPKDGSWTFEELARAPGVTATEKGGLVLDVRLIDKFREHVGGFVMDDHVQHKLRKIQEQSKAAGGARPHKVAITDLVDPFDGNKVNTKGLLKGCRAKIGSRNFALGKHQAELLQAMADNDGRILAAHFMGTGKTVSAIASIKMMQNLTLPDGSPHPNRPKKTIVVVPKNTAAQWQEEVKRFTYGRATIVGSTDTTNAVQMWQPPEDLRRKKIRAPGSRRKIVEPWDQFFQRIGMSRQQYEAKIEGLRQEALKKASQIWNPAADDSDIIVVPQEYFQKHSDELKRIGGFDGMIVDEAHGIQNQNFRSDAILNDWNQDMKTMMLLTGTPITNRLNTLPRYIELLSKGEVLLGGEGSEEEKREHFEDWAMTESAVLKQKGMASSAKMDINPQASGRLIDLTQRFIHVATSADVVDKVMPAVLLDENSPVPQGPIQSANYRRQMQEMTPEDQALFARARAAGAGEAGVGFSVEARRSIQAARMVTNTPAYKRRDGDEFLRVKVFNKTSFEKKQREERAKAKKKGRDPAEAAARVDPTKHTHDVQFKMPTFAQLRKLNKGKWPTEQQIVDHYWDGHSWSAEEQLKQFKKAASMIANKDYNQLAGKSIASSISKKEMTALKRGDAVNGVALNKRVVNPEFGPEGIICRGVYNPKTGKAEPIRHHIRDAKGKIVETIEVPIGKQWIRDPSKKSAGFYYDTQDWQFRDERGQILEVVDSDNENADVKVGRRGQRPKKGSEQFKVNQHPARRRERVMFDLAMTTGNAKTDQMERDIAAMTDPQMGGSPDTQMIWFANAIGSGVRCVESKLRLMGYQDVNEALSDALRGDSVVPPNGKYYVTYLNNQGTLGDRDINSEIFRKRKNEDGSDSEMSMFVHRTLHGVTGGLKPGKIVEGWAPDERRTIKDKFGIEVPSRVMQDTDGTFRYFYEKDMTARAREKFRDLDGRILQSSGAAKKKAESQMAALLSKYWKTDPPLTDRQVQVFNNCQHMVASDAAQVGLNWGNATKLMMFDSLFSPMEEWQRITRAARMLPPAIRDSIKPQFNRLEKVVDKMGKRNGLKEFDGTRDAAMAIVEKALDRIPKVREQLMRAGLNPEVVAESFLAQRALDRIRELRPVVEQRLKTQGRRLPDKPKAPGARLDIGEEKPAEEQFIHKTEITTADVTNEILEGSDPSGKPYLSPFERQILRSRKYLVDVKRYITSVEVPLTEKVQETYLDPATNKQKTRTVHRQIGMTTEFPSGAEMSKLTRARAKQVPFEALLLDLQSEIPVTTSYDFEAASPGQLAQFEKPSEPTLTAAEKKAKAKAERERKRFYGRDKSGKTRRQRELEERRRIAKEARERRKKEKAAIRAQRRREAMERARKSKVKKSMPLDFI